MKRQYRLYEMTPYNSKIDLYHGGVFIKQSKVWVNEIEKETYKLKSMGYTRAYTKDEVEEAKQTYLHMLENALVEPDEEMENKNYILRGG